MSRIEIGRASVVVSDPDERLLESLRAFNREDGGQGQYENLYTIGSDGKTIATLPGFANRVRKLTRQPRIIDKRIPMPNPDFESAMNGMHEYCAECVIRMLKSGGGIVSVPEVIGCEAIAASIMRAFPRSSLLDRGTPLSVVITSNRDEAFRIARALRRLMPNRDVGVATPGSYTDSEDVIVSTYGALCDIPCNAVGVLLSDGLPDYRVDNCASSVSAIRNAARWAVCESPLGGPVDVSIMHEGLFGPLVATTTYSDAVKAGAAAPITVCWLSSPKPNSPSGSAPFKMLEAIAMQSNPRFCGLVADIIRNTNPETGAVMVTKLRAMAVGVMKLLPGVAKITRLSSGAERRSVLEGLATGDIRKAIICDGDFKLASSCRVMVVASCEGGGSIRRIPWMESKCGERSYIVDFSHEWDVHNGRPGMLAMNDMARERRYTELGFCQVRCGGVNELPFA